MRQDDFIFHIITDHQYFLFHLMTNNLKITKLFHVCIFPPLLKPLVVLPGIFSLSLPKRFRDKYQMYLWFFYK